MAYNLNTFLQPISDDDKNILIYDENGVLKYTINPFSVTNIQVRGNIITISVKSGRTVLLDFLNANLAKDALPVLQSRIHTLSERKPNFIDKQIENWVTDYVGQTGGGIDFSPSLYGTVSIFGTLSMDGNIIPSLDYTWNLGSPTHRWNNIYVRDALVASQSLYLGDTKLSTDGQNLIVGDRGVNKYEAYSTSEISIPVVGAYVQLTTDKDLSYVVGDSVKVANRLQNFYDIGNYAQDSIFKFFIAFVDNYDRATGEMSLIATYTKDTGFTASNWYIKYSSDIIGNEGGNLTIENNTGEINYFTRWVGPGTLSSTSSLYEDVSNIVVSKSIIPSRDYTDPQGGFNLGSTSSRWENIYVKDALVASQSIYLGGMKLSSDGAHMVIEDRALNKYESFSYTELTIGVVGEYLSLTTEKNLSYTNGDSIKVANRLQNFFDQGDYSEDSVYKFFIAFVDFYNRDSGELNLIITYTKDTGFTSSTWYLKYNSDIIGFEANLDERFRGFKVVGTSSTTLNIPEVGFAKEIITQQYLGFYAGQEVIVYNQLPNNYETEDYSEDDGNYFIGKVDYYYPETGQLTVISEYSYGSGTFSDWQITLSSLPQASLGTTASFEQLDVNGIVKFQSVVEKLNTSTQSSNISYDFNLGNIWYHDDLTSDFSADFINVPTYSNVTITSNIIISQSATAYLPNAVTINGASQTIKWVGGTPPTGNANQIDVIGFSFINFNGSFVHTLAQLSSFA